MLSRFSLHQEPTTTADSRTPIGHSGMVPSPKARRKPRTGHKGRQGPTTPSDTAPTPRLREAPSSVRSRCHQPSRHNSQDHIDLECQPLTGTVSSAKIDTGHSRMDRPNKRHSSDNAHRICSDIGSGNSRRLYCPPRAVQASRPEPVWPGGTRVGAKHMTQYGYTLMCERICASGSAS